MTILNSYKTKNKKYNKKSQKTYKNNRFIKKGGSAAEPQPSEDALLHEIMYYRNKANTDDYADNSNTPHYKGMIPTNVIVDLYYTHASDLISQYKSLNYNEQKLKTAYDSPLVRDQQYNETLSRTKHGEWIQNMAARKATNDSELAAFKAKIDDITNPVELHAEFLKLEQNIPYYAWFNPEPYNADKHLSSMTILYRGKKQLIESRLQLLQRPVTPPAAVTPRKLKNRSPRKPKHSSASSSGSKSRSSSSSSSSGMVAHSSLETSQLESELKALTSQLHHAKKEVSRLEQEVSVIQRTLDKFAFAIDV